MVTRQRPPGQIPDSLNFGISTRSLDELREYFRVRQSDLGDSPDLPPFLPGYCYVCQSRQGFLIEQHGGMVNWRETLRCPGCKLINRWRSSIHVFEAVCKPEADCRLYLTEEVTPLYQVFRKRFGHTVGSEFVEGVPSGRTIVANGHRVRVEDVTTLSFAGAEFDAVLSFDVLEHVPDYRAALREFFRVLRPGGWLIFSAPFSFAEATEVRASLREDGSIEHHLPPDYHGDPLSDQGVLCFQSFGMEVLGDLKAEGFESEQVFAFTDLALGYLDRNILFLAQKPGQLGMMLEKPRRSFRRSS